MAIRFLMISAVENQKPIEVHHPPLGFGYLASSLRKKFSDEITFKVINQDIIENIKRFQPNIIGISSVSRNYGVAKEYARIAKRANIPVIMGGVHITFMPQTMTQDMDIGISGEGEITILDLISSFMANGKFDKSELRDIEGIIFRDKDELVITKPRELIRPLDALAYPARDLLTIDKKSTHMLSSRGCPYHCVFCSTAKYTRNQVRYASAEYVAAEIESLYENYKAEYITIYDDLFAIDDRRVIKIQELLEAKNLIGKFRIAVNIRPDLITDGLAEVLHHMNVDVVALGTESGCQETLDYLKSGSLSVEENAKAIMILKKHRIIPYCSFVFGSPQEGMESILETVRFIKDNDINYFDINVLTPFPGTPVWDYALSRGLVSDDMDWSKLDFYISSNPIFLSEKLSLQEISEVCVKMAARKKRYQTRLRILEVAKHPHKHIGDYLNAGIKRLSAR